MSSFTFMIVPIGFPNKLYFFRRLHDAFGIAFDEMKDEDSTCYNNEDLADQRMHQIFEYCEMRNITLILILDQFNKVFNHLNSSSTSSRLNTPETSPGKPSSSSSSDPAIPQTVLASGVKFPAADMWDELNVLADAAASSGSSVDISKHSVRFHKFDQLKFPWNLMNSFNKHCLPIFSASSNNEPVYNWLIQESKFELIWHPPCWSRTEFDLVYARLITPDTPNRLRLIPPVEEAKRNIQKNTIINLHRASAFGETRLG